MAQQRHHLLSLTFKSSDGLVSYFRMQPPHGHSCKNRWLCLLECSIICRWLSAISQSHICGWSARATEWLKQTGGVGTYLGMKFNLSKCTILSVSRSRTPLTKFYSLCGVILSQASEAKYLDVSLSCDMEWAKHIQQVTSSCSSTIGLLHRNLSGCPIQLRERACISLIRSRLEYASAIWDLHLKKHINSLEAIQRRAAHFTTQDFGRTSSVSRMLEDLGWLTLKERRRNIRLFIFSNYQGQGGGSCGGYSREGRLQDQKQPQPEIQTITHQLYPIPPLIFSFYHPQVE